MKSLVFSLALLLSALIVTTPLHAQNAPAKAPTIEMVAVPGGVFQQALGRLPSKGTRQVKVDAFLLGSTELTQAQYEAVMAYNPSWFKEAERPVEKVSWFDAVEFCNRLSRLEGLRPAYTIDGTRVQWDRSANGYRLPTEAEWEFAARGAGDGSDFRYAGSNNVDEVAWYVRNAHDRGRTNLDFGTHKVATRKPNSLGIYDLSGNVWEWCWDWDGPFEAKEQENPAGPPTGSGRVSKGGSWFHSHREAMPGRRWVDGPYLSYFFQGFRLARSAN